MLNDPKYLCSSVTNGTLVWKIPLSKLSNCNILYSCSGLNIVGINPKHPYTYVVLLIYIVTLLVSAIIDKNRAGELWCFTSNCIPLLLLIIQKIFKNKLDKF